MIPLLVIRLDVFLALAFLPVADVVNGFEELSEDNIPAEFLISYRILN